MAVSTPIMDKATAGMREIFSALSSSEARYFDEDRYSEAEIRKALADSLTERKIDAMKRLLAAVSVGRDASKLFPDVVKNVSFQSLELKKLIYIYLVQYAENNRELALLSINSFQKDLSDRSQLVRASALRAMASIKVLEVIQLVMVAVRTASADSQAYVRKTSAQCMTKVYAVDPDQFLELRGLLLKLMSDHEVQVVGSAVMAFRHIVIARPPANAAVAAAPASAEGALGSDDSAPEEALRTHLALLHPLFRRLCQDILVMEAWAQQSCIDVLLRYCRLFFACPDRRPQTSDGNEAPSELPEDLANFLKSLKMLLTSSSKGVNVAAVVALCYLAPAEDLKAIVLPWLRCLRQAPVESSQSLLVAFMPVVEARPALVRPHLREFFVHSFDPAGVKELKLKIIKQLVDETNVQMVLRELQAYVAWHSYPDFVALAVQGIAHVALTIPSVADSCLRGLVKMLDSKCEVLSCEAVVALRALLQQRHQSADSGLGAVLPHLARYLEDLAAPTARASVVWIIGQYQREAPRLGPDVVRRLAKTFANEKQEVKQQILGLALKVWAFHTLHAKGELPARSPEAAAGQKAGDGGDAGATKQEPASSEESLRILPRLEAIVDHISNLASYDASWDVRDTARALKRLRLAAKEGFGADGAATGLDGMGSWYCRACVGLGGSPVEGIAAAVAGDARPSRDSGDKAADGFESTWIIGSLAQALDFPLETYRPLPNWSQENSPDELRKPKETPKPAQMAVKSISSSNVGNVQHMENRVLNPSNISKAPVASKLEDLDLFYSDDGPTAASGRGTAGTSGSVGGPGGARAGFAPDARPTTTLEQMRLGGAPLPAAPPGVASAAVVGSAVFGEDDESEEEAEAESDKDEDDESWKYCLQASSASPAPAASAPVVAAAPSPLGAAPSTATVPEAPTPVAVSSIPSVDHAAESAAAVDLTLGDVAPIEGSEVVPPEPPPAAPAAAPPVEDSLI